jgi:hypothetical protein
VSLITEFSASDFLKAKDDYLDMVEKIKTRAVEIAKDFGKIGQTWYVKEVIIYKIPIGKNVKATFLNRMDESQMVTMEFEESWLFSDDYKSTLDEEPLKSQIEHDKEYMEYLRLKDKFEKEENENLQI